MSVRHFSARAFNQQTSEAKRAALDGPVFTTDRGRPAYVFVTSEAYQQRLQRQPNIIELLAVPGAAAIEFEPPRLRRGRQTSRFPPMFVLDTNVVSELRKDREGKADANLTAWGAGMPADRSFVSAITIFELELGVLLIERRDLTEGAVLRRWLVHSVTPAFQTRILAFDLAVARRGASLRVPVPASNGDAMIAASTLVHDMTVVTRNEHVFSGAGVHIHNPWTPL